MSRIVCSLLAMIPLVLAGSRSAVAATGGPDAYGWYTFADQNDGVAYDYVDISSYPGTLQTSIPDATGSVPLPVPFFFYGHTVTNIVTNANGFLSSNLWSNFAATNACPLPTGAGNDMRVFALHDDLDADTYYRYFDPVEAAAVGYSGQTEGISVFQWVGTHDGGGPVDFEAILFHHDSSILMMVAADAEGGAGSTMGIQSNTGGAGLHYACDTAGSIVPGVTAVLFTLAPDSDCCTASPSDQPGCLNIGCQEAVCASNPSCCSTAWDVACEQLSQIECAILCGAPPPPVTINEIRIDQPGNDTDEYVELVGPPGTSLDGLQYISIGSLLTGSIKDIVDLAGNVIPPDGHFVIAEGTFTLGPAPELVTPLYMGDTYVYTHMLVAGLSAANNTKLDSNYDGVLDFHPWDAVLDTIAIIDETNAQLPYGPVNPFGPSTECILGPTCQQIGDGIADPVHVYRCPDGSGTWRIGNTDPAGMPMTDSPGGPNNCLLCGDGLVEGLEVCDDGGETATCNADCTPAACGDGVFNGSAGEECDDGGESVACDADCTLAGCGDAVVNMTAGEECDDAVESAWCDADCTTAVCGDGWLNPTAGEACDAAGGSAACDVDCTPAMCGDRLVNPIAGEECDDSGESPTCDVDCTLASCGDLMVNSSAGETCDEGARSETCNADCTSTACGDGVVNPTAGEQCDDMGESATCDADCTSVECGDGVVNASAGEECDDGNTDDADGCSADCIEESTDPADDTGGSSGGDVTGDTTSSTSDGGEPSTGDPVEDTDSAGVLPSDQGCSCSSRGPRGTTWPMFVLVLLGLGVAGRRSRHQRWRGLQLRR